MALRQFGWVLVGIVVSMGALSAVGGSVPADVSVDLNDSPTTADTTATPKPTLNEGAPEHDVQQEQLDVEEIEWAAHQRVNEIRERRGLDPVQMDGTLQSIARYHSQDMAERGYFSHVSPDGLTIQDRYEEANYQCRRETNEPGGISTGSENIAQTYADSTVLADGATVDYDGNETKIGRGLVRQWMGSAGHRENILTPYWQYEGIGVAAVRDNGDVKVLATQNFC